MNSVASLLVASGVIALIATFVVGLAFLLFNKSTVIQVEDEDTTEADLRAQMEALRRKQSKLPQRYGKHPFEVCIVVSFLFSAISLAVFGPAPTATSQNFSPLTLVLLGISIALGSIVALVGIFMPDAILSAFFEAGGMLGIAGPVTVYLLAALSSVSNPVSALGVMSMAAIWSACVWRFVQIARWIRWIYLHPDPEGENIRRRRGR